MLLSSCDKKAEMTNTSLDTSMESTSPVPMTDENILAEINSTNKVEVQLGNIAQDKAKKSEIKSFGKMMVTDHTMLMNSVDSLANALQIHVTAPNGDTSAMHAEHMRDAMMQAAATNSFDSMYINDMISGHEKVLTTLQEWQGKAAHPEVNTLILNAIPIIQRHLDAAKKVAGK